MSWLSVFPALLSDAPTLSSGSCREPNGPPVGAILVVFAGYPCVDIICEHKAGGKRIINSVANVECSAVISNNPSFRHKQSGGPRGSDSAGKSSYPLTENYTHPLAQATGRIA